MPFEHSLLRPWEDLILENRASRVVVAVSVFGGPILWFGPYSNELDYT